MEKQATRFGEDFCLTLITDDAVLAAHADGAGVNRIGIDLEYVGKAERQTSQDARLSRHNWDDLSRISKCLSRADLFVRINPIHAGTEAEIETVLELGAKVLMLPNFRSAGEAGTFVRAVRGRARVSVLVEMAPAVVRIREILDVPGIDEVMIGLNDLHLQCGVANHFEVLGSPLVDMLASEVLRKGLPLSIGGVGRVGDTAQPIPTDLVYAQYPRLRATGAWLARSFANTALPPGDFQSSILALRNRLSEWASSPAEDLERARVELSRHAAQWRPALSRASHSIA
ncbi:MAG: aldolase [Acidobacteriia bacterium]|nr:aldolase [Terriglobia bacterium]